MQRADDYRERRAAVANLTDEELHREFWTLAGKVVDPLVELARTHTSPSIERSVLLRMGFSSLEAKGIVQKCLERGLLGKGAGNCVYRLSQLRGLGVREAGLTLATGDGWDEVEKFFRDRAAGGGAKA
ncbi:MAG: ornithine aminomutase subunit alpha [Ignavibacteriales bacterium]